MRSLILAVLLGAAFAASAQLYRWTDERGRVHVTDTPPPPTAKNIQRRSAETGAAPTAGPDLPYSVQLAAKNHPVTLFTSPDCEPCGTARALLNARGVPFREVSVVSEKQAEELKKAVGSLSVPSLRVGSDVQKGFEQGAYHTMLDLAGYPRAGILPPRNQAEPKPAAEPAPPAAGQPRQSSSAADDETSAGRPSGPYVPR